MFSAGAPSASPTARPSRAPRARSRSTASPSGGGLHAIVAIGWPPLHAQRACSCHLCHAETLRSPRNAPVTRVTPLRTPAERPPRRPSVGLGKYGLPCWREPIFVRTFEFWQGWMPVRSRTSPAAPEGETSTVAIIETEAPLHEAHRDNHTHRDVNGGWLRPAVFGAMDGLVSNLALMTGVAGGAVSHQTVVITGLAGLAAGAFSMAAGEYTSVASQRELVQAELDVERAELRKHPADEMEELAALYMSRGVEPVLAREVARQLSKDPEQALEIHAREELGIDPDDLPSPTVAAVSSLRLLRPRRAAARPAVPAGGRHSVACPAARAGGALRLRRAGGPGDGTQLVVQRTAPAGAGRDGRGADVRAGRTLRRRPLTAPPTPPTAHTAHRLPADTPHRPCRTPPRRRIAPRPPCPTAPLAAPRRPPLRATAATGRHLL